MAQTGQFKSAFCHCVDVFQLLFVLDLRTNLCVCGCLHIINLKLSLIITKPVYTELFSVKPTFFFWDFDFVPPKKTFYKYVYKLYFQSCTTLLFLNVCQTSTVCLSQIFLYKKPTDFLFIAIGLINVN